jgi:hypothetical protein
MRLIENNDLGEPLYQCDYCHLAGPKDSCVIEENDQHFCMSCWYEKLRSRVPKTKRMVVVQI